MYNFLNPKLTPNVLTECPITDGYEATNLISDIEHVQNKGFLAFSAIRPPVELEFQLICPINLHYIAIWNTVHTQKSSGFEIYAKSSQIDYKMIGKTFSETSGFSMCSRKHYGKNKPHIPSDFSVCFFKSSEQNTFNFTDNVKIKIIRTISSVPCIGKIEIWGEVAKSCSKQTKETIDYLMKPKLITSPTNSIKESIIEPGTSKTVNFEIPQEFLDDISCEVMSIPMTLPSGKTVDQSTLEKHAVNDSKWGRVPSDPYTGIPFTSNNKPILNSALKNRIDQFLFEHKEKIETKIIQRTVGRKPKSIPDYAVTQQNKKFKLDETNDLKSTSSDDLDLAIEETFTKYNITRYTNINSTESNKKDICMFCTKDNNLYEILNCKHLICRHCLISMKSESMCKKCNQTFNKSNVHKYHC